MASKRYVYMRKSQQWVLSCLLNVNSSINISLIGKISTEWNNRHRPAELYFYDYTICLCPWNNKVMPLSSEKRKHANSSHLILPRVTITILPKSQDFSSECGWVSPTAFWSGSDHLQPSAQVFNFGLSASVEMPPAPSGRVAMLLAPGLPGETGEPEHSLT